VRPQPADPEHDQVDRNDEIQQSWNDQDQDPGDQRDRGVRRARRRG
jgi:hypothetical protein